MVFFVFGPSWVYALLPSVVIYVKTPCCAVTVALLYQSIQENFYRIMKVHCVPYSCIRFFIQIWLRSLHMMGQFQNHVAAWRVSHHDDSLHDCFLALCRCVFCLVGVHHALYCNFYQNWIMGVSVFHSDYCDICDSNTWAAHCFSGFDLRLLCMLVKILSIQFCNIVSLWSVLVTGSVFLGMDEGHFKWVLNHIAYENPASFSYQWQCCYVWSCPKWLWLLSSNLVHWFWSTLRKFSYG